MVIGHYSCWGCPIHCGKDVRLDVGDRAGQISHGPEYETLGAFGSLCLCEDPSYISAANDLANRLGMDTITAETSSPSPWKHMSAASSTKRLRGGR